VHDQWLGGAESVSQAEEGRLASVSSRTNSEINKYNVKQAMNQLFINEANFVELAMF
jgi:hypothetical protein